MVHGKGDQSRAAAAFATKDAHRRPCCPSLTPGHYVLRPQRPCTLSPRSLSLTLILCPFLCLPLRVSLSRNRGGDRERENYWGTKRPLRHCTTVRALGTAASDSRSPTHSAPCRAGDHRAFPASFSTLICLPGGPIPCTTSVHILYHLSPSHLRRHGNGSEVTIDRHGGAAIKHRIVVVRLDAAPPFFHESPAAELWRPKMEAA